MDPTDTTVSQPSDTATHYTILHSYAHIATDQYIAGYRDVEHFAGYCQQCHRYRSYWACPPFEHDLAARYLAPYPYVTIIGTQVCFGDHCRAHTTGDAVVPYIQDTIAAVRSIIDPQLLRLEDLKGGARAFYAGSCHLCLPEPCSRVHGAPCRHPQQMRPSLEALGFDLVRSASELLHTEMKWGAPGELPEYLLLISGVAYTSPLSDLLLD